MSHIFDFDELAGILSLELEERDRGLVLSRQGRSVLVPSETAVALDPAGALGRHLCYGVFFGIRLAIDRTTVSFDLAQERPDKPDQVYRHHEVPSVYGERLPRLVPDLAVAWFEALVGEQALTSSWIVDGLRFVYILETGKHLHVLCEEDLGQVELTRDKLLRDARHALFYDSYKLKPRDKERTDAGLVRIFRTSEGLGASRALLLPDFDYDAARESGCVATPSRDVMIIGRPADTASSEAIFERVCELTVEAIAQEPFPLSSQVHRLTSTEVRPGESQGSAALPPTGEAYERALPCGDLTFIDG